LKHENSIRRTISFMKYRPRALRGATAAAAAAAAHHSLLLLLAVVDRP
jgi:hypothetical protein